MRFDQIQKFFSLPTIGGKALLDFILISFFRIAFEAHLFSSRLMSPFELNTHPALGFKILTLGKIDLTSKYFQHTKNGKSSINSVSLMIHKHFGSKKLASVEWVLRGVRRLSRRQGEFSVWDHAVEYVPWCFECCWLFSLEAQVKLDYEVFITQSCCMFMVLHLIKIKQIPRWMHDVWGYDLVLK